MDIKKIKDFFIDIKTWIGIAIFIICFGIGFSSWAKLPEKVKIIEKKAEEIDKKADKNQTELEKYMAVNEEYKKLQMEQQKILIEILKKNE
jgi:hypothetical protein